MGAPLLTVAVGAAAEPAEESSGNVLVGYGTSAAPARRRRVRTSRPVAPTADGVARPAPAVAERPPAAAAPGSAPGATVRTPRGDAPERPEGPVPVISPLVRRLARENGLDLRRLAGSGPDGLILRADVEDAIRVSAVKVRAGTVATATVSAPSALGTEASATVAAAAGTSARPAATAGTRIPLKGLRGAVADKLSRSRREIPDATCWVDADATELMRARTAMNAAGGSKISLLALLARICTSALGRFPELNSTVDTEARESSCSTRCISGSPRRPTADSWSPSCGTRTPGTPSR